MDKANSEPNPNTFTAASCIDETETEEKNDNFERYTHCLLQIPRNCCDSFIKVDRLQSHCHTPMKWDTRASALMDKFKRCATILMKNYIHARPIHCFNYRLNLILTRPRWCSTYSRFKYSLLKKGEYCVACVLFAENGGRTKLEILVLTDTEREERHDVAQQS